MLTKSELNIVKAELLKREPIFHHPEFGTTRIDFENMMDSNYWEVGASGNIYTKDFVLKTLEERYKNPIEDNCKIEEFNCLELSSTIFLVTYTLYQNTRVTRRATIWTNIDENWKIIYHQGTLVNS